MSFPERADIAIAAEASDPDGTVVKVEFFANDKPIGTVTQAPFVVTLLDTGLGSHQLRARATDDKGATGESLPVSISVKANDKARRVAIVQNFPDPEISKLQAWVTDLDLSLRIFNQEGLTLEALKGYDLVIWDDLGSSGLTANDVDIFQQKFASDIPLYLIGDDLVQSTASVPGNLQSAWSGLLHLKDANRSVDGKQVNIVEGHPIHPVVNGPLGLVGYFRQESDHPATVLNGTGEVLLGESEAGPVLLADEGSNLGTRSVTQNFPGFNGVGVYSQFQREKLFKNAVWWLLKLSPPPPFLNLALTMTAEPKQVSAGQEVQITATVQHGGELVATGITLVLVLPPQVTYLGSANEHGSCLIEGDTVICNIGQLDSSRSKTITLNVRLEQAGPVSISASVSPNQPEAVTEDNSAVITLGP